MAASSSLEDYAAILDQLKASDPDQYAEIMAQLQASAGTAEAARSGERVAPEPSFVIKTHTIPASRDAVTGGTKVFINVTHSPRVPGFRKRRHFADGKEVEGLHVPLAIGPPRNDVDRAGKRCVVYDVVVNTEVTMGCSSSADGGAFRRMVCGLMIQNVEAKFGRKATPPWTLSQAYKLPRLANQYKGSLPPPAQWVRAARSAGVEVVEGGQDKPSPETEAETRRPPGKMSAREASQPESVAAAMSVMAGAASTAPVGPDGIARVDMTMKRLGEDDDEDDGDASKEEKAQGGSKGNRIDSDSRALDRLQRVGETIGARVGKTKENDLDETAPDVLRGIAEPEAAKREPGGGPRSLIQEVTAGEPVTDERQDPPNQKDKGGADGLIRVKRVTRERHRAARPPQAIGVSLALHRGKDRAGEEWWLRGGIPCDASRWTGVPAQWRSAAAAADGAAADPVTGVSVTLQLDASHPGLLNAVEEELGRCTKTEDLWLAGCEPGRALSLATLAASTASPTQTARAVLSVLRLKVVQEALSLEAAGHKLATVMLPCHVDARHPRVRLDVTRGTLFVCLASEPASRLLTSTIAPLCGDGTPAVNRRAAVSACSGDGVRHGLLAPDTVPVDRDPTADTPVGEDEALPEDRFHAKDPMSQHFLQEKQRSKADAAEKRRAKEQAAAPAPAPKPPSPSSLEFETEADIGLL